MTLPTDTRKKLPVAITKVYAVVKKEFYKHHMPVVELIQFQTNDPFKVLVTTILSARTKDEITMLAAQRLFFHINTLADLKTLTVSTIEKYIYPVGFYQNKAIYLKKLPDAPTTRFNGVIPQTVEELVRLPGVGRKTANLVVAVAFNKPAVCVDIHVHRICNRLGYVATKTPLETEMKLREILPVRYWITINSYLVSFGQHSCTPINPHCSTCPIKTYCKRMNVKTKFEP